MLVDFPRFEQLTRSEEERTGQQQRRLHPQPEGSVCSWEESSRGYGCRAALFFHSSDAGMELRKLHMSTDVSASMQKGK